MSPKPSTDIINIANGIPIKTDLLAEVAPGVFVGNLPSQHTPRYGLVKYVSDKKGGMTSVVVTWSGLVKVSKTLPEKIGIQLNKKVLRALVYSGLVKGVGLVPFTNPL